MIARAKGRHFLVYNGAERVVFDAKPAKEKGLAQRRKGVKG